MSSQSPQIPILVLAGGKGTRLQSVNPSRPKPMVIVGGYPFLYYIFQNYAAQGFSKFLISTGYLAEQIEAYPWSDHFPGLDFHFYREASPLGTGGAVKAIFDQNKALDSCWVVNGDTLITGRLPSQPLRPLFVALDAKEITDAAPNLVCRDGKVIGTIPPTQQNTEGELVFDSGVAYVTRKTIDRCVTAVPFSFHALMAPSIDLRTVDYLKIKGTCYDIGTPERLKRFERYLVTKETL